MSLELLVAPSATDDPLAALESVAEHLEIEAERVDDAELHIAMPGAWRDAGVWFTWRPELSTLQMGAPLDIRIPKARLAEAALLVTMVNERLWLGHFDLWTEDQTIVFRYSVLLPESGALDASQARQLIHGAAEAVDRFLPAFNFLVWGGKSPEDALAASLFETQGNA